MRRVLITVLFSFAISDLAHAEPTAFQSWAKSWARAHKGGVHSWWSADLDQDGKPDYVAIICTPVEDKPEGPGAYLVESAAGERFAIAFDGLDFTGNDGCVVPDDAPLFETSDDKVLSHDPAVKRASNREGLALRNGKLVVIAQDNLDGRVCQYENEARIDWATLRASESHASASDFKPIKGDDCKQFREHKRDDAVLLLTTTPIDEPTFTQVVRGEAPTSDADASLRVSVSAPTVKQLAIRVRVVDDTRIAASDKTIAALEAADHVTLFVGRGALRVARLADDSWFVVPLAGALNVNDVTVGGDANGVTVTVPRAWANRKEPSFVSEMSPGAWIGSLVVAFTDVDVAGQPARRTIATAPIPRKGTPSGLLVKLPGGQRWPTATGALKPIAIR